MPVEGFRTEWFTVGQHRVLLESRASFPDENDRFIASVVAKAIDHHSDKARLVHVFFNDKSSLYHIVAASTDPEDRHLGPKLTEILQSIYGSGNYDCEVQIVEKGDEVSDHYHHMEHLSVSAGIADDRWLRGKAIHDSMFDSD